ncbi:hypothetical protein LZ554_003483 [Drepanopeziza brunnea f. sp. 'monogermtubi']|nr:hypothetical protein LZ554_003483 [Drepanopeziza brunnea f. sp. 'monogermtubi']
MATVTITQSALYFYMVIQFTIAYPKLPGNLPMPRREAGVRASILYNEIAEKLKIETTEPMYKWAIEERASYAWDFSDLPDTFE